VKFNKREGDIIIIHRLKQISGRMRNREEQESHMLETQIIDTGYGISKQKADFLFKPFREINHKQGLENTRNQGIGLGLASSQAIARRLGGDIQMKQSKEGLTILRFKIPVSLQTSDRGDRFQSFTCERIYGTERELNPEASNYLEVAKLLDPVKIMSRGCLKSNVKKELVHGSERSVPEHSAELERSMVTAITCKPVPVELQEMISKFAPQQSDS